MLSLRITPSVKALATVLGNGRASSSRIPEGGGSSAPQGALSTQLALRPLKALGGTRSLPCRKYAVYLHHDREGRRGFQAVPMRRGRVVLPRGLAPPQEHLCPWVSSLPLVAVGQCQGWEAWGILTVFGDHRCIYRV